MPAFFAAVPRPIVFIVIVALIAGCGTPRLSKPSERNQNIRQETSYSFPQNPPLRPRPQKSQAQKKEVDLLALIARINRASESAARGSLAEARNLASVPRGVIKRLPVPQQTSWYRMRSQLAQESGDLSTMLLSEQQLLIKTGAHSQTQFNSDLFARLLEFNEAEITLAREQLAGNSFASGWLKLLHVMTSLPAGYSQQKLAWRSWQRVHRGHSAERFPPQQIATFLEVPIRPPNFALLLPRSGAFAPFGDALAAGFIQVARHPANRGWQVKEFDVAAPGQLHRALVEISETGVNQVVGPLNKELAQQLWDDTRITSQLALNFVGNIASPLPRGQLGLGLEDEAEWIARLLNTHGNLRVALLQQQGRNPSLAATRLRQKITKMPETFFFDNNRSLVSQLENALGVSAQDIKYSKDAVVEYHEKIKEDPFVYAPLENPADRLRAKVQIDLLLVFADANYAAQIIPLLDFYYASQVKVLGYSAAFDLVRAQQHNSWDGMYLVDIPAMDKSPSKWHEWVAKDFAVDQQFYRFYALGVDAALVAYNLARLAAVPGIRIRGATGKLGLDAQTKRITRDLQLYRMKDGKLVAAHPRGLFSSPCTPTGAATGSCL